LDEVKDVGVKKVRVNTYLCVFQTKGSMVSLSPRHDEGVYFKTTMHRLGDILGKLAEITHRNGLDIFA